MRQNICHPITHTHTADRLHYPDHKVVGNNKKNRRKFYYRAQNKSVFSLVPRLSTRHCPHLLLSAVACMLSIGNSCPRGAQQQTAAAAVDRWDRQTDGRSVVL